MERKPGFLDAPGPPEWAILLFLWVGMAIVLAFKWEEMLAFVHGFFSLAL